MTLDFFSATFFCRQRQRQQKRSVDPRKTIPAEGMPTATAHASLGTPPDRLHYISDTKRKVRLANLPFSVGVRSGSPKVSVTFRSIMPAPFSATQT